MTDCIRDCPTCKHDYKAQCLAPAYKALTPRQQDAFWKEGAQGIPCKLWEPAP